MLHGLYPYSKDEHQMTNEYLGQDLTVGSFLCSATTHHTTPCHFLMRDFPGYLFSFPSLCSPFPKLAKICFLISTRLALLRWTEIHDYFSWSSLYFENGSSPCLPEKSNWHNHAVVKHKTGWGRLEPKSKSFHVFAWGIQEKCLTPRTSLFSSVEG